MDEGHQGAGGDAWFERRDELARRGFVFEYSATFGQALAAANRGPRTEEYARAIAFNYSYPHFHGDGYGKDFDVANLSGQPGPEKRDVLMLGNLLAFLQQRLCFAKNRAEFMRRNLEPPLLLMLGARVTGGTKRTDMAEFMGFLDRVASGLDRGGEPWLEDAVGRILGGKSGIEDERGDDVFAGRLDWLREEFGGEQAKSAEVCNVLRKEVFRADAPGGLQFCPIRGAPGEAALRAGGGDFFGLMFIGKDSVAKLRELLKGDPECGRMSFPDGVSAGPMFAGVSRPDSPVNILIGAKKFMQGWDSWRVSGMGLLHVGSRRGAADYPVVRARRATGRGGNVAEARRERVRAAGFAATGDNEHFRRARGLHREVSRLSGKRGNGGRSDSPADEPAASGGRERRVGRAGISERGFFGDGRVGAGQED